MKELERLKAMIHKAMDENPLVEKDGMWMVLGNPAYSFRDKPFANAITMRCVVVDVILMITNVPREKLIFDGEISGFLTNHRDYTTNVVVDVADAALKALIVTIDKFNLKIPE